VAPVSSPILEFFLENVATAVLIIGYLAYELRWGRGKTLIDQMNGIVAVVIAIAEVNPDIDEDAVRNRLNGDLPADFRESESHAEMRKENDPS
jgi:hypothetical protein